MQKPIACEALTEEEVAIIRSIIGPAKAEMLHYVLSTYTCGSSPYEYPPDHRWADQSAEVFKKVP
jgi:hypothetical protein